MAEEQSHEKWGDIAGITGWVSPEYLNLYKFAQSGTRWNFKRKEYYSTTSIIPMDGVIVFSQGGDTIEMDLSKNYNFHINQSGKYTYADVSTRDFSKSRKKVNYFEKDKILYIYLDRMNDSENAIGGMIKQVGKGKKIQHVIIDVRENPGGNDQVWHNTLQAIIDTTFPGKGVLALKKTDRIKNLYAGSPVYAPIIALATTGFLPEVPGEEFYIHQLNSSIKPDSNSLNFKGKIYVLQNENTFSSAHGLSSYASQIDRMTSVGIPTGTMAGLGLNAPLFQLPNSKYSFRMVTVIDVSHVKRAIDVYQDVPEILIDMPSEEKKRYFGDRMTYEQQSEEYLYQYDYTFKKLLEIIKK